MSTKLTPKEILPLFLSIGAILYSLYVMFSQPVDGDIWWLCYVIEQMMNGKIVYKDVVETNPPLVIALYYPFVVLAKHLYINAGLCIKAAAFIFSIISAAFSTTIISRNPAFQTNAKTLFLIFLSAFLLIPNMTIDFAQREHLFIIFCLPYFLLSLPSISKTPSHSLFVATGVLAGVGFSLKPHFLLVFVTTIIARNFLSGKKFWVLNIADYSIISFGALYAVATYFIYPEFYKFLPFALATYGSHFFSPSFTVLRLATPLYAILLTAYLSRPFQNRDLTFMAIVIAATTIELVLQFKPWTYITLPALTLAYMLFGMSVLVNPASNARRYLNPLVIAAFCIIPTLESQGYEQTGRERCLDYTNQLKALNDAGANSVYAFGESYGCNFPSIQQAGLLWASRHQSNWMFRGIYGSPEKNPDYIPTSGKEALADKIRQDFLEDFRKTKPDILVIDITENGKLFPRGFNFANWLNSDNLLKDIFANYKIYKTLNYCPEGKGSQTILCRYQVYVRKGISTP